MTSLTHHGEVVAQLYKVGHVGVVRVVQVVLKEATS